MCQPLITRWEDLHGSKTSNERLTVDVVAVPIVCRSACAKVILFTIADEDDADMHRSAVRLRSHRVGCAVSVMDKQGY